MQQNYKKKLYGTTFFIYPYKFSYFCGLSATVVGRAQQRMNNRKK